MSPRAAIALLLLASIVGGLLPRWTGCCAKSPSEAERMTLGEQRFAEINRRIESMLPSDRGLAAEAADFLTAEAFYRQQLRDLDRRNAAVKAPKDAEMADLRERLRRAHSNVVELEAVRRELNADATDAEKKVARLRKALEAQHSALAKDPPFVRLLDALAPPVAKRSPLTLRIHLTHHPATKETGAYTLVRLDEGKATFRLGSVSTGTRNSAKARRQATEAALAAVAKAVDAKIKAHGAAADKAKGEIVAPKPKRGSATHGHIVAMLDLLLSAGVTDVVFEGEER